MKNPAITPLTGLRFVAAFAILYGHATGWTIPFTDTRAFKVPAALLEGGGMPLFFVLSGFVIHYNYATLFRDRPYAAALREFLVARFSRIYPLYLFFFACGAVIDFTASWISSAPRAFASYIVHGLTLTQSWVYKIVVNDRILLDNGFGLAWSISTEFFFYVAYTVLVFAVLALRRPGRALAAGILFSAAALAGLAAAYLHRGGVMELAFPHVNHFIATTENWDSSFFRWLFYYSPYIRVLEFILGCLTAQLYLLLRDRAVSAAEQAVGAVALYAALALLLAFLAQRSLSGGVGIHGDASLPRFFALNFGGAVPIAVIIFCVARYRSAVAAFLSLPWIVWLGEISYSIYAVHTWTLRPFIRPPVGINLVYAIDAPLRLVLGIAFTIIVASATYRIIELPCRRYLRARLMPARTVSAATAQVPTAAVETSDAVAPASRP